jgi:hypothetical protein
MIAEIIAIAVRGLLNRGIIGAITTERTPPVIRARNFGYRSRFWIKFFIV